MIKGVNFAVFTTSMLSAMISMSPVFKFGLATSFLLTTPLTWITYSLRISGTFSASLTMIWIMPERSLKSIKRMEPRFLLLLTHPNKVTDLPTSLIDNSVLRQVLSILFSFFLTLAFIAFTAFSFMLMTATFFH